MANYRVSKDILIERADSQGISHSKMIKKSLRKEDRKRSRRENEAAIIQSIEESKELEGSDNEPSNEQTSFGVSKPLTERLVLQGLFKKD